eukprot:6639548-Pyramimonas_sp.AAC.1
MGSDFTSAVNTLAKKSPRDPIPHACNALLKANPTSHVAKDGRCTPPPPPPKCDDGVFHACAFQVQPPARDPCELTR